MKRSQFQVLINTTRSDKYVCMQVKLEVKLIKYFARHT